jgi:hypothetical protein
MGAAGGGPSPKQARNPRGEKTARRLLIGRTDGVTLVIEPTIDPTT